MLFIITCENGQWNHKVSSKGVKTSLDKIDAHLAKQRETPRQAKQEMQCNTGLGKIRQDIRIQTFLQYHSK